MATHYIIMSSSYSEGTRIALHFVVDKNEEYEELKKVYPKIIEKCGEDVSVSTHFVEVKGESWKDLSNHDSFFRDVKVIATVDEFIKLIKKDRKLMGIDVAKYITTIIQCTHLKLETLVYLCYADYLCKYGKKLYQDKIYALKYGPVVDSVYKKCKKKYGYRDIVQDEKYMLDMIASLELPFKSRIMFTEDGFNKEMSIKKTLKKYSKLSVKELVSLVNRDSTPWNLTKQNEKIEDETIREYHINESL